jgi:IS4 transposase
MFKAKIVPIEAEFQNQNCWWVGQLLEKVKKRQWKYLEANTWYQRVSAKHHVYRDVVLVVRSRQLKNEKVVYDILLCNKSFYNGVRIHKSYKSRWEIELHFKYYKQYLSLGKAQLGKFGSIRSQLACVAIAALMVALFRRQAFLKMSSCQAVKLMTQELRGG